MSGKQFSPPKLIFTLFLAGLIYYLYPFLYSVYATEATMPGLRQPSQTNILRATEADRKLESARARMASEEAALKEKLTRFKDQRKAQLAQKINDRLKMVNQNRTEQMGKGLAVMSKILDRVRQQASRSATPSASTSATLNVAQTAVLSAQTAVGNQSAKDYTITVSSESNIFRDAKAARDRLFSDLTITRELVIVAKQSVASAVSEVKREKDEGR